MENFCFEFSEALGWPALSLKRTFNRSGTLYTPTIEPEIIRDFILRSLIKCGFKNDEIREILFQSQFDLSPFHQTSLGSLEINVEVDPSKEEIVLSFSIEDYAVHAVRVEFSKRTII